MKTDRKTILKIAAAVIITVIFALLAGLFTKTDSKWYISLEKSPLMPPGLVFTIVWIIMYALFAAAFSIAVVKGGSYVVFTLELALLALWCYVFFQKYALSGSLVVIIAALVYSVFLFRYAYDRSRIAGYFILPLCFWLAYATAINYQTALLN